MNLVSLILHGLGGISVHGDVIGVRALLGTLVAVLLCVIGIAIVVAIRFTTDLAIPGWASTTIIGSFFGALNALGIGILGEYAIRIYDQVRARPHYIIARTTEMRRGRTGETSEVGSRRTEVVSQT